MNKFEELVVDFARQTGLAVTEPGANSIVSSGIPFSSNVLL